MTPIHGHTLRRLLAGLLSACLVAASVGAEAAAELPGWTIERGTSDPSYAVVEPATTNLNIDTVVLACEEAWGRRVLQLQLYLSDDGPLQPRHPRQGPLKDAPRAEISIDGKAFPVALLFADTYVVLADGQAGPFPSLSDRFLDAMQTGRKMILRFDLLREEPGEPSSFDGEALVDLEAPGGHEAIAAMRRCVDPARDLQASGSLGRR